MNAVASLTFGIASAVAGCIAAAAVASIVMAESETHQIANLSAPDLWTTSPVRVDPSKQDYQRVAPVYSSYVTDAPKISVASGKQDSGSPVTAAAKPALSTEHLTWCSQRYRSYDPATNSYRAFSGEMRSCASPYPDQDKGQAAITQADTTPDNSAIENQAASAWCAARYQSYRAEDNTYQPFDGPRRQCQPPSQDMISAIN